VTGEASGAIPGWYGKLPYLGDFASRRLPEEFIQTWDLWLQEVLHATRASLGQAWLDRYLTMPIWRFVLLPGLAGPSGWAGVLMPSVDRVGRQFPLTLAAALSSDAAAAHAVFQGAGWFASLEEAALGVLDPTHSPDDLDRALADCTFAPPGVVARDTSDGGLQRLPSVEAFDVLAQAEAFRAWGGQSGWQGLWWTRGRVDGDALMLTCAALPTAEEFAWLLESRTSPAADARAAGAARPVSEPE
jgi:type VI secretion system protein ImpM